MKTILRSLLFSIFVLNFIAVGFVRAEGPGAGSVDWQRTQLENQLTSRITKAVGASIPEKYFIVNVSIELKLNAKKDPLATGSAGKDQWTGKELAGKENGRIFIDKLDFDLPYPEGGAGEIGQVDIFENISSVKASILADNSLTDARVDLIKKITNELLKTVTANKSDVKADVKVEKAEFSAPPEKWDVRKMLTELSIPITLILITLFVCVTLALLGLVYFMNYKKIESRKVSILEAQNTREQTAFQAQMDKEAKESSDEASAFAATADAMHGVAHEHAAGGAAGGHEIEGGETGFNRFKHFLKDNPEKTLSLIKQWVKSPDQAGAKEALAVLPQLLSTTELLSIFNKLAVDERKLWKKHLTHIVDAAGYKLAEGFVASQIVDSLLGNIATVDDDLSNRIAQLSASECVAIAYENSELGGMLVNLLPSARLPGFFALMPRELVSDVTMKSVKLQDDQMVALSPKLSQAIEEVRKKGAGATSNAFLEKAPELLKGLDPEKEVMFLNTLASSGEHQTLRESVRKFFPSELVLKLPPKLLKAALDRVPLSKRGDLITSRTEEEKEILLNSIGAAGSKGRDVIDLEILEVAADEIRKKRIEKQKDQLWAEFLASVRGILVSNPAAAQQAEGILEVWISEKTGGQSNAA